jgi:hypothetical protein
MMVMLICNVYFFYALLQNTVVRDIAGFWNECWSPTMESMIYYITGLIYCCVREKMLIVKYLPQLVW